MKAVAENDHLSSNLFNFCKHSFVLHVRSSNTLRMRIILWKKKKNGLLPTSLGSFPRGASQI